MALVSAEGGTVPIEQMKEIKRDSRLICERIETEYDRRRGAGALWLRSRLLKKDWLYDMQAWAIGQARENP